MTLDKRLYLIFQFHIEKCLYKSITIEITGPHKLYEEFIRMYELGMARRKEKLSKSALHSGRALKNQIQR